MENQLHKLFGIILIIIELEGGGGGGGLSPRLVYLFGELLLEAIPSKQFILFFSIGILF